MDNIADVLRHFIASGGALDLGEAIGKAFAQELEKKAAEIIERAIMEAKRWGPSATDKMTVEEQVWVTVYAGCAGSFNADGEVCLRYANKAVERFRERFPRHG